MTMNGNAAVAAYQKGGCTALREFTTLSQEPSYLLDAKNQLLCPEGEQPDFNGLLKGRGIFPVV